MDTEGGLGVGVGGGGGGGLWDGGSFFCPRAPSESHSADGQREEKEPKQTD